MEKTGLSDVFREKHIDELKGNRIAKKIPNSWEQAENILSHFIHLLGISISHNGNLVNTEEPTKNLQSNGRHLNTSSDSEVILNVFAMNFKSWIFNPSPDQIFMAVEKTHLG